MEKRSFGKKKIRNILFVRTFQKLHNVGIAPPLGLLYLASFLRRTFGNDLVLKVVDMKIEGYTPH
ncbi:MAG TPA: hypothetical protein PKL77_09755, partial [Candidatus Omnitrophota bacterium]|nr:hypothetical protein [Candidatus Omnitrophota bacterium]